MLGKGERKRKSKNKNREREREERCSALFDTTRPPRIMNISNFRMPMASMLAVTP
jgi:hypothetical protein